MASTDIPEVARRLIHDHIPSIERLEILLLLFEAPERAWRVEEIEARIRSTPESIRKNVSDLVAQRILVADVTAPSSERFRYEPTTEALHDGVAALALAYRMRRVAVIELIYAERRDSVRSFSAAFKLGRGK